MSDAAGVLVERPDDADANLALGKFHALARGDWDRGLQLLARGGDLKFKALAVADLATPADAVTTLALATAYATQAESESGVAKVHLLCRAVWWYEQAQNQLSGLERSRVERLVAGIDKGLPPLRPIVLSARLGGVATWVDVTDRVRSLMLAKGPRVAVKGDCGALGLPDVAPAEHKSLVIAYRYRGRGYPPKHRRRKGRGDRPGSGNANSPDGPAGTRSRTADFASPLRERRNLCGRHREGPDRRQTGDYGRNSERTGAS